MATMIVRDNGTGFKPETGSKRHGLGLVRRLVEQIQGNLMVASQQGTVWTINFPLAFATEPVAPAI
jgi:two-component sensor histidine kinase